MKSIAFRSLLVRRLAVATLLVAGFGAAACQARPEGESSRDPALSAPTLVADIGAATERPLGAPGALTVVDSAAYFTLDPPEGGRTLWRSSPTGATMLGELLGERARAFGSSRIVPFRSGLAVAVPTDDELQIFQSDQDGVTRVASVPDDPIGLAPPNLLSMGDSLFFSARPTYQESVLWYSDGSPAGTRALHSFTGSGGIAALAGLGATAYIAAGESTDSNRVELWRSDGTTQGTVRVLDRQIYSLVPAGERLFVFASTFPAPDESDELWVIDQGQEPVLVATEHGSAASAVVGERLFFASWSSAGDYHLYVSDGTGAGTHPIGPTSDVGGYISELVAAGDRVFFVVTGFEQDHALWVSDGTEVGTSKVRTFAPAVRDNAPYGLTAFGERVVFAADDGSTGMELWASDGTVAGTVPLSAIGAGPADGVPGNPRAAYAYTEQALMPPFQAVALGDRVLFSGGDGGDGFTLWSSAGTPASTQPFGAVGAGVLSGDPQLLRVVGDRLLFFADDGVAGRELWASDGTPEGTALLRDLNPGDEGSLPDLPTMQAFRQTPVALDGTLYLVADDPEGYWRWQSDGTPEGTVPLADPLALFRALAGAGDGTTAFGAVSAGGVAYLYQSDVGLELWRSDGTEAGTSRVGDVIITRSPLDFGPPPPPVVMGGRLFFAAQDEQYDTELWTSDGTAAGTRRLRDLNPGESGSYPVGLTVAGESLFFLADDGVHGHELWASDGTAAGTRMLRDIWPGEAPIVPDSKRMSAAGGPCPLGLFAVAPMAEVAGTLFFLADDGTTGCELWRSDGTEAGTRMVRDIRPGPESGMVTCQQERSSAVGPQLIPHGAGFLFVADDGSTGCELWFSDGTQAGTRLVIDLRPGPEDGVVGELVAAGGLILMAATDGASGSELWSSDGTTAGTRLVADLRPGPASSLPANLTVTDGRVFFSANDGLHGVELWRLDYQAE